MRQKRGDDSALIPGDGLRRQIAGGRLADEVFRVVVEATPNAIVLADAQGRILLVNAGAEKLFGYTRGEMIGQPVGMLLPERLRAAYAGHAEARPTGKGRDFFARRKDGSEVPVEIGLNPIETPEGPLILSAIIDITERRKAEVALREKEAQFSATDRRLAEIVHGMTEACFALDAQWRFTFVNDRSETLFRRPREEMLGRSIWEVFPQLIGAPMEAHYRRTMTERVADTFEVFSTVAERWLDVRIFPTGEGLAAFLLDIQDRRIAEQEIQRLNTDLEKRVIKRTAQLEAANNELESFSYSVSHDLRAPLRAVDGFSQAILDDYGPQLPDEGRRYLQTIRKGAQQMGMLIDDLLTFSRLSRAPLKKEEVDTGKLVRSVLEDLSAQREGRQIDLRIGDLPACAGDPALLRQVWINLLSNALKYTKKREAAVVEIGCEASPDGNVFLVRDNGTGFDMRYAGKLFGVFQRLHRAEEYEGTGVGLALVQRIIQRHGGRVWADAAIDHGATFYFTLEKETKT